MSKVIAAVRGTPHRLETEQRAIDTIEREIGELEQQRASALLAEDPADAVRLAERVAAARSRLETHRDRLRALQGQRRREETGERQRRKDDALQAFGGLLKARASAAARVDAAVSELAAALTAYRTACREPFATWPDVFPSVDLFVSYSNDLASSRIAAALRMQSPGAAYSLLTSLSGRLGSLADGDIANAATLLEDVRSAPLPERRHLEDAA